MLLSKDRQAYQSMPTQRSPARQNRNARRIVPAPHLVPEEDIKEDDEPVVGNMRITANKQRSSAKAGKSAPEFLVKPRLQVRLDNVVATEEVHLNQNPGSRNEMLPIQRLQLTACGKTRFFFIRHPGLSPVANQRHRESCKTSDRQRERERKSPSHSRSPRAMTHRP